ncbi:MAG: sugar kinase [Pseudomonadota bacterium]
MATISVFGEPLLELASASAGSVLGDAVLGVAGDTLNTSVYLSRLGHDVRFITALGEDAYSDAILGRLRDEGVSTQHVGRHPSRVPGFYAIRTDDTGERFFTYWRDQSATRAFFELADASALIESAIDSELFYFSGISLAILSTGDRDTLIDVARRCNGRVAFDGNYRPYGWQSTSTARAYMETVGEIADAVLPTSEDDDKLFGAAEPVDHASRWRSYGVDTVVVKNGPDGAWVFDRADDAQHVTVDDVIQPVDTTGAGDSFNAAFLAAWLNGQSAYDAALAGNRLAAQVIKHHGALIPLSAMPGAG